MNNSRSGRVRTWSTLTATAAAAMALGSLGCVPSEATSSADAAISPATGGAAAAVGGTGGAPSNRTGGNGVAASGGAPEAMGTGGAPEAPGTGGTEMRGTGGRGTTAGTGGRGTGGGASLPGSGGASARGTGGGTGGLTMGSGGLGGGATNPAGIPIFVAGGYRGRTTLSCDDGASWVANHSDDDSVCPNHDCGEVFNTITGVTYGDGNFFISRGWGMPGNVLRSNDGVTWTQIYSGKQFGGVAYGTGTLVIGSGWQAAWYSTNAGQTVTSAQDTSGLFGSNTGTIRNVSYQLFGGGRFILIPDDGAGARKIAVSKDGGKSYALGTMATDLCASRITDVVSGGDTIVGISDETGYACRSLDGGATWTGKQISAAGLSRQMVWTGTEFLVYGGGSGYRSADGDAWTKFAVTPSGLRFGAMARSSVSGTLVASSPYGSDYGAQAFYRSTDGTTWQPLSAGKFVGSHLIEHMAFGFAQRSTACP